MNAKTTTATRTAARSTNTPAAGPLSSTLDFGHRVALHHAHLLPEALGAAVERLDRTPFVGTVAYVHTDDATVNVGYLDHAGYARVAMSVPLVALADVEALAANTTRPFATPV